MPVFANRPAACVLESGELAVLLTEPAQRSRGLSYYLNPESKKKLFTTYETPRRREMLSWLLVMNSQETPTEPTVTPILIFEKDANNGSAPHQVHYLRHAQSLEFTYYPKTKEFHVLFYWNLYTPVKQGPPKTYEENVVQTFLSTYKNIPIAWTLKLGTFEPHAELLVAPETQFPFFVGDPPLDPGGAWPGVYNYFDIEKTLLVGASALHKNFDPYQITDAHQNLPATPGFVIYDEVQKEGSLISLSSVESFLNDHTQHLYHQREVQASRMASRVLMFARGQLHTLTLKEALPERDDPQTNFQGLTIGASVLTPGILQQPYVGANFVHIDASDQLPFGGGTPDFPLVIPGDVGHQFQASGGTPPYQWCLRRTRSSASNPAREPSMPVSPAPPPPPSPGSPPPSPPILYPFDDNGDLLDPEPAFPSAVRGGGLPPGMLLSSEGVFYGTPAQWGVHLFRLHVKDANGLRGETTIRFEVLQFEGQVAKCTEGRGDYPATYKATISYVDILPLSDPDFIETWKGRVGAIGGETQAYFFTLPNKSDPPRQQVPIAQSTPLLEIDSTTGTLILNGLTPANFDNYKGVWVFEVQVTEHRPKGSLGTKTCDTRGASISIGTTIIGGMDDALLLYTPDGKIPEGKFAIDSPAREYLILDIPKIVSDFTQGKNLYLAGSPPFSLNPGQGGLHPGDGIITSVNPGFANPVQVIGVKEDALSPAHTYSNWLNSNPTTFFRDVYDRFDPTPVAPPLPSTLPPIPPTSPPGPPGPPPPPPPPGPPPPPSNPITGAEIDDFIPVGRRIRPLWPV